MQNSEEPTDIQALCSRPVVYDYPSPPAFLRALLAYHRTRDADFSLRKRLREISGCSPALVSLILNDKRRLRRDLLPTLAEVFLLTATEVEHIDGLLCAKSPAYRAKVKPKANVPAQARNSLLKDWLNVYVKDCVNLKGFAPTTAKVYQLLGGLAPPKRIQRSIDYLHSEGFWRKSGTGKIVPEENKVLTSSGIAVPKIRAFHKAALDIAKRGLDRLPPERRKAYATVLTVDSKSMDELKTMMDRFHKELQDFIEEHPEGSEHLCQVLIHMTPIGGQHDET